MRGPIKPYHVKIAYLFFNRRSADQVIVDVAENVSDIQDSALLDTLDLEADASNVPAQVVSEDEDIDASE